MIWRIWYADGSVVDGSTLTEWSDYPSLGVVAVYQFFDVKNGIVFGNSFSGCDWYWMTSDELIDSNRESLDGPNEWADFTAPEGAVIKKAAWTTDDYMNKVNSEILDIIHGKTILSV
jgi:hypothetical protein